jgi:hypothetical protein
MPMLCIVDVPSIAGHAPRLSFTISARAMRDAEPTLSWPEKGLKISPGQKQTILVAVPANQVTVTSATLPFSELSGRSAQFSVNGREHPDTIKAGGLARRSGRKGLVSVRRCERKE